jgi:hypothetical protein
MNLSARAAFIAFIACASQWSFFPANVLVPRLDVSRVVIHAHVIRSDGVQQSNVVFSGDPILQRDDDARFLGMDAGVNWLRPEGGEEGCEETAVQRASAAMCGAAMRSQARGL